MVNRPNILLITVDTLRADHLGCYGYPRATSPRIDALARQGVLWDRMFCAAIPTHPSYTTLYTGQHPITHGIVAHGGDAELSPDVPVLPELFLKAGYTTCAVDNLMRERLWFGRGYEHYVDPSVCRVLPLAVTCEELNARAIPWLRAHAERPFFLLLHYWDPHAPYNPPRQYRRLFYQGGPTAVGDRSLERWWKHPIGALARDTWLHTPSGPVTNPDYVVALYDQEVRHVDEGIGELVAALDDLGLAERTLVAVVSDHGESLTEHGIFFDHHGLYDCTTRIPLVMRWPGVLPPAVRLPQMFQNHDIAPTLLEAAGLPVPRSMEGRSFWKLATGEASEAWRDRIVSLECTFQAKWCLRTDSYRLILAREPDFYNSAPRELYDLLADPGEECNVADARPDLTANLEQELESWIANRLQALRKTEDPLREQGISLKAILERP